MTQSQQPHRPQVLIIGLDGATFHDQRRLPHLAVPHIGNISTDAADGEKPGIDHSPHHAAGLDLLHDRDESRQTRCI